MFDSLARHKCGNAYGDRQGVILVIAHTHRPCLPAQTFGDLRSHSRIGTDQDKPIAKLTMTLAIVVRTQPPRASESD